MERVIPKWTPEASFVGREAELAELLTDTSANSGVVAVSGPAGVGKTAFVAEFARRNTAVFVGGVHWITCGWNSDLSETIRTLGEGFRLRGGRVLVVLDEADRHQPGEVFEALSHLSTKSRDVTVILIGVEPRASGVKTLKIGELSVRDFAKLVKLRARDHLSAAALKRLQDASRGNPRLFLTLLDQWEQGDSDPDKVSSLLLPWTRSGILGPDGSPLNVRGTVGRTLITDVRQVSSDLLQRAARSLKTLHEMPPRLFEEVVAELLRRRGYDVTLTPITRDGGKDMYAARRDDIGSFIYVVECKRYHPLRPVGVGLVRALHGVAQHERVNAAMMVTTSVYSNPARSFARTIHYQMQLRDYFDLRRWLANYR